MAEHNITCGYVGCNCLLILEFRLSAKSVATETGTGVILRLYFFCLASNSLGVHPPPPPPKKNMCLIRGAFDLSEGTYQSERNSNYLALLRHVAQSLSWRTQSIKSSPFIPYHFF